MPIFGKAQIKQRPGFLESLKSGAAVPIISDEVLFDLVMGGHTAFVEQYAAYAEYPMEDKKNLPRIAKYHKLRQQEEEKDAGRDFTDNDLRADYLNYVKNVIYLRAKADGVDDDLLAQAEEQVDDMTVSKFANFLGYPRFDGGQNDPLLVLANLPFRFIVTTSPFTFIEQALIKAKKEPHTVVCRWRNDLRKLIEEGIGDSYRPDKDQPLVYHLFGLEEHSSSLVLTEDDYLDFLVDISVNRGDESRDSIHALVRGAFSSDLIVLGYSLNSWAFRALYAGLIKSSHEREKRGVCCVQLLPSEAEKKYLYDYMQREARLDVFWGDIHSYAQEMRQL